jgi:hypothetical protein
VSSQPAPAQAPPPVEAALPDLPPEPPGALGTIAPSDLERPFPWIGSSAPRLELEEPPQAESAAALEWLLAEPARKPG